MDLLYILDLIGVFVFAISGVLISSSNRFDFFGAWVIAFVTALGGGTLRDILMGSFPVSWIENVVYIYIIILAVVISALLKKHIIKWSKTLFLFDTIGLSAFTIIGVQKALEMGMPPFIAILMGTISAVFGGVLRDVLCNEQPLIFRKEIYATASILGGNLFLLLHYLNCKDVVSIPIVAAFIIALRVVAVKKKWSLPVLK